MYGRLEDFITLLYLFMNAVKVFVRQELWVNVPVAIFFPMEDCACFRDFLPMRTLSDAYHEKFESH